jgi:hypothetical protein
MPLLITPPKPFTTPCGLLAPVAYAIVNRVTFDRLLRQASFSLGYYVSEAASLPDSGVIELPVTLPRAFSFGIQPTQANDAADPQAICEAYAQYSLQQALPIGTLITQVR